MKLDLSEKSQVNKYKFLKQVDFNEDRKECLDNITVHEYILK